MLKVERKLPATETYACSKSDAKAGLLDLPDLEVHFGATTHFEFDSACHHRPTLNGTVVASARVTREREAIVNFYPVRRADYSEREHGVFVKTQLRLMHDWISRELGRPDTEVVGNSELIVQSVVDGFTHVEVTFG